MAGKRKGVGNSNVAKESKKKKVVPIKIPNQQESLKEADGDILDILIIQEDTSTAGGSGTGCSVSNAENIGGVSTVPSPEDACSLISSETSETKKEEVPIETPVTLPVHLRAYFTMVECTKEGEKLLTKATCKLCNTPSDAKVYKMYDRNTFGLLRHLRESHQVEASSKKTGPCPQASTQTKMEDYNKGTPTSHLSKPFIKRRLEDTVLDQICLDGEPLSLTSKIGYRLACQQWSPGVKPPNRWRLLRYLKKKVEGPVSQYNVQVLRKLDYGQLSIQIDFWASRAQEHIFGVTGKFLDDEWNLQNLTLAFKRVTGVISFDVVKSKLQEVLNLYGINQAQVSCIMADGGSNICKAFNEDQTVFEILDDEDNEEQDSNSETEVESDDSDSFEEDEIELETGLTDSNLQQSQTQEATNADSHLTRKHCLCHVLNLIVNDAVKKIIEPSPLFNSLARAKKVINHFKHSNKAQEKLRKKTGGTGLRAPVVTRWNSLLFALERLTDEKIFPHVVSILADQTSKSSSSKFVELLTISDQILLKNMCRVLKPIQLATMEFQKKSVTSCDVIWQLQKMLRSIMGFRNLDLEQFRLDVLDGCKQRLPKYGEDKCYVLAAALDPRQKLVVFGREQRLMYKDYLNLPSEDMVRELLENELHRLEPVRPVPIQNQSIPPDQPDNSDDIFAFISESRNTHAPSQVLGEHESYFLEPVEKTSVLEFWKASANRFPLLSKLAKKYLAVPASSADAERLFSVAGALQRARRSKLKSDNLERMLLYRDYRLREIERDGIKIKLMVSGL